MPGEEGPEIDMTQDIARDIGQSVEIMILNAKHDSESKVGKEIHKLKSKMDQLSEKIKMVAERVARAEPTSRGLLKTDLQKSIAKLEEVWDSEAGALKHELWQTIQAHNHNADLLKHHKDAIDQVQNSMGAPGSSPELEQVQAQILQVDKVVRLQQQKDQHLDQLMQRIAMLQQQLGAGPSMSSWPPAGLGPISMGAAAGQAANAKKNPQRKAKAKPKPAAGGAAAMPTLRAEAAEFVPGLR